MCVRPYAHSMDPKQTLLVTGGAGFIGSNYLNKYVTAHPDTLFVNIDALTYAGNLENITVAKEKNYRFHQVDIRDLPALEKIFASYHPTGVIHFAAESHVDMSIENPALFVETNVLGTHNLLLLSKKYGVRRFYQISTDEVYGSLGPTDPSFTASSPLAPNSPYSASKASADLLVRAYHRTFGLDAVISRCSNNYGPNQDLSKLIPKFITLLLAGKKVPLYAKGEQVRDWLYVEDHIDAIDLIFRKGKRGAIYTIGGGAEMTNRAIVQKILALTGCDESFIETVADRLGHDFRYSIDARELEQELGWKPSHSFTEGMQRTFDFYRERFSKN